MTVRELINSLLDSNMDKNVKLYLPEHHVDENNESCEGYLFNIESAGDNTIVFSDWRKSGIKAKWIQRGNTIICSSCNTWFPEDQKEFMLYCPYCLAKMKGVEKDD